MAMASAELTQRRAESLAAVYLTRRPDLHVERYAVKESGIDFLVTILKEGASTGRLFGVQTKGIYKQGNRASSHNGSKATAHSIDYSISADLPFPVCLFLFSMQDDAGYWRWLLEPRTDAEQRQLLMFSGTGVSPLTNEALAEIVERVNRWYDVPYFRK